MGSKALLHVSKCVSTALSSWEHRLNRSRYKLKRLQAFPLAFPSSSARPSSLRAICQINPFHHLPLPSPDDQLVNHAFESKRRWVELAWPLSSCVRVLQVLQTYSDIACRGLKDLTGFIESKFPTLHNSNAYSELVRTVGKDNLKRS